MKQLILLLLLVNYLTISACDICIPGYSIRPNFTNNYIGFGYNRLATTGFHEHVQNESAEHTHEDYLKEIFSSYTLEGRVYFKQIYWSLRIPFYQNYGISETMKGNLVIGVGDIAFTASKELILTEKFRFFGGIGLEFPTGNFNVNFVDPYAELGSQSLDLVVNNQAFWKITKGSILLNNRYQFNSTNSLNYKYGNQFGSEFNYLRNFLDQKLISETGFIFEYAGENKNNSISEFNTGGTKLFINLGIQYNIKAFTLILENDFPVIDRLNGDQAKTKNRLKMNLLINI